jgi:tripartite-type tricarboxylate transporter receptor subunit TctC
MKLPRRKFLHLAAVAAALPTVPRFAWAQTYPTRPITMIVPFAAGGPSDVLGRILAERMRASLGQPVIIDNVVGAAGSIGVGRVARAAPDGYTLVVANWSTHVANGALYTLPYDVVKDFEPVALATTNTFVIVARKSMPADDLKGLVAWLKANPDKASAGTAGVGNATHIVGVLFQNVTGTRFQFVPYRGTGPAMQDLVAGQIDMMFADTTTSLPHVGSGAIKAYAVMLKSRLRSAPDIPTVDEAGLPMLHFFGWFALFAPKGTPKGLITRVNEALVDALADPAVGQRVAAIGMEVPPRDQQTPEALAALQKAETEKWWPIIKAANIKAE